MKDINFYIGTALVALLFIIGLVMIDEGIGKAMVAVATVIFCAEFCAESVKSRSDE